MGAELNCPNCGEPGITLEINQCCSCGQAYAAQDLLEWQELQFLLEETANWEGTEALRQPYAERLEKLQARLVGREAAEPEVVAAAPTPAPAPKTAPAGVTAVPAAQPAKARPRAAPPSAPPKERVPFDRWLLSERNIKIALYAGATLLVVAGLIFVGVSWGRMPGPAKFAVTVLVTGLMYLGGYLLFRRPSFRIGGIALLAVGSGFVIVNFAILQLYVLGPAGLRDDLMWLIASSLCLVLYLLTAHWTRGDLFTYLSLAAVVSIVTATLVLADARLLHYLPAYALLAYGILWLARAVQKTGVADYTRLPLLVVSQLGMVLVAVAAVVAYFLVPLGGPAGRATWGSPWLAILALAVGVLFYATADLLFKWLAGRWAAAVALPLTVTLVLLELDASDTLAALVLMVLALAYQGVGHALERREGRRVGAYPLYATGYAVALSVTATAAPDIDGLYQTLLADVALLLLSAAIFRSTWWIYGAAWLFTLPVYLILHLYVPSLVYRGLFMGLLGLNYAFAGYALGRRTLFLGGPFLSAAAFLSVVAVALTWGDPVVASLVLGVVAVLYLAASLWLGWNWLLLAALLAVHLLVLAVSDMLLVSAETLARALTVSYGTLGLVLLLSGVILRRLGQARWSWPLYLVCILDLADAYLAGLLLGGSLAVGVSAVAALVLFGLAWVERVEMAKAHVPRLLAGGGVAAVFVGHFYVLNLFGLGVHDAWPPITAGLCAAFVALAWLLRRGRFSDLYAVPLRWAGLGLMAVPMLGAVALLLARDWPVLLAVTFAIAGLTYGADGVVRRRLALVYGGVGASVVVIWGILMALEVRQPQAYVFPAGLTLLGIGWTERRHGRSLLYQACAVAGLVVLMGTAFLQSLGRGNWPYALLLMAESLAAIGWGVRRHLKRWVQVGGLALVANAIAQLGPAFVELSGWIQIGLTGAILLGGGMLALLRREEILLARERLTEEWRQWQP